MKTIYSKKKVSQLNELYDYVDDDTVEKLNKYKNNDVENVDYEALEQGDVPIDADNVDEFLVDNIEEEIEQPLSEDDEQQEPTTEDVPDSSEVGVEEAMLWAIKNSRVIKIFYTTKGRGSRDEKRYLKREKGLMRSQGGVNIYRIIEPHAIFTAKNGNRILMTYDRSVRRIRAFIVSNITDYNFTRNRLTKEPQYFNKRNRVMPKPEKGINAMKNTNSKIMKVAKELEDKGMTKSAAIVKDAYEVLKQLKQAQYVGIQGYWIRNRRCWDNCYRQKRTTQPKTPAQEVWMECWDEYKKSINNNESGWEKYAFIKKAEWDINDPKEKEKRCDQCGEETDTGELDSHNGCCSKCYQRLPGTQTSAHNRKKWNKFFISTVESKIKKGISRPEAIYATIEESSQKYYDGILDNSVRLAELADTMRENKMEDLGEKLAEISFDLVREAGLMQGVKNLWQGVKDTWNKGEKPKKKEEFDVAQKLEEFSNKVFDLAESIQKRTKFIPSSKKPVISSNKRIVIEAGEKSKIVEAQIDPRTNPKYFRPSISQEDKKKQEQEDLAYDQAKKEEEANQSGIDPSTIQSVNKMAYEASKLSNWISRNIIQKNPNFTQAQQAVSNLDLVATDIKTYTMGGNINLAGLVKKLNMLGQSSRLVSEQIKTEQSSSVSDVAGDGIDSDSDRGGTDGSDFLSNKNNYQRNFQIQQQSPQALQIKYPLTGNTKADEIAVKQSPKMWQYINTLNDTVGRYPKKE